MTTYNWFYTAWEKWNQCENIKQRPQQCVRNRLGANSTEKMKINRERKPTRIHTPKTTFIQRVKESGLSVVYKKNIRWTSMPGFFNTWFYPSRGKNYPRNLHKKYFFER